jgi:hypothetical protein
MSVVDSVPHFDRLGNAVGDVTPGLPCQALMLWPDLRTTPMGEVVVSRVLGEGRRCAVFVGIHRGRQVVLKIYHARAVAKHARRMGGSLAGYEYARNVALRSVSHLAAHVAAPIGFVSSPCCELFVQEYVSGESIDIFLRTCSATKRAFVLGELRLIVEYAHESGVFDLDLRACNVLVRRSALEIAQPVLFDFNKTPYHVRPPNPLVALLLKLRVLTPGSRDHRCLRRLHRLEDAERVSGRSL